MNHRLAAVLILAATLTACGHDFEPPDHAERMEAAEARYSPALFDSVRWESDSLRALEGNDVYAAKCRRCHGQLGRGGTDYARERGFEVGSLVEPGWHLAEQLDSVRHLVFVGHGNGMPIFGIAGISPREIDASAYYVLEVLRPDVLGEGGGS